VSVLLWNACNIRPVIRSTGRQKSSIIAQARRNRHRSHDGVAVSTVVIERR
jgi:hypothetical protein